MCTYLDTNDLYLVSDILITDYSSVLLDYSILKRPIIYYMYDLEYYAEQLRGFYIDISELPGIIVKTEVELEESIANISEWTNSEEYIQKYKRFNDTYTYLDDGRASQRVVERLFCDNKIETNN